MTLMSVTGGTGGGHSKTTGSGFPRTARATSGLTGIATRSSAIASVSGRIAPTSATIPCQTGLAIGWFLRSVDVGIAATHNQPYRQPYWAGAAMMGVTCAGTLAVLSSQFLADHPPRRFQRRREVE